MESVWGALSLFSTASRCGSVRAWLSMSEWESTVWGCGTLQENTDRLLRVGSKLWCQVKYKYLGIFRVKWSMRLTNGLIAASARCTEPVEAEDKAPNTPVSHLCVVTEIIRLWSRVHRTARLREKFKRGASAPLYGMRPAEVVRVCDQDACWVSPRRSIQLVEISTEQPEQAEEIIYLVSRGNVAD